MKELHLRNGLKTKKIKLSNNDDKQYDLLNFKAQTELIKTQSNFETLATLLTPHKQKR